MNGWSLPRHASGSQAAGWWGMVWLVVIESMVVASFLTSWFYLRLYNPAWPPDGVELPEVLKPGLRNLLLVGGAALAVFASRAVREDARGRFVAGLLAGAALTAAYLALGIHDLSTTTYDWKEHVYTSLYWTLSGYALLHAVTLVGFQAAVGALAAAGHFGSERPVAVQVTAIYAVFVAVTSVLTWLVTNVAPYAVGGGA